MRERLKPPFAQRYHPGDTISGRYQLEVLLGEGGMGVVWRARNLALDAPVAIKVLSSKVRHATLKPRLLIEARAAAKLAHPAIVKVFDVGETERAEPYIVMELLSGTSLGTVLRDEGRLAAVRAVRTLLPIADALQVAHTKAIVHRDVKPDNIFIVHDETVVQPKLVDFGVVKMQESAGSGALTRDGVVMGSPTYLSPEQARGADDVDHRADVWAFAGRFLIHRGAKKALRAARQVFTRSKQRSSCSSPRSKTAEPSALGCRSPFRMPRRSSIGGIPSW